MRIAGENDIWPDLNSGDPTKPGTSGYKALKLCDNIRKLDSAVKLYTVGFQTPPEAEILRKKCAGAANFHSADSAQRLVNAFKDIASKLSVLRVSG